MVVVLRRVGAGGQGAGEHGEPGADRCEADELEAGEGDESGGEEHHPGGQQGDAQGGGDTEPAAESGDPQAARDDRKEREPEARRREVVHHSAHRDGDQADDRQMHACRDHRHAEGAGRATPGRGGKYGYGEYTVGGEEKTGYDRGAVEDVSGQIVEGAQLREVELPPRRVASREDRYDDARSKRRHGSVAEVVGMVTSPVSRAVFTGDRDDAQAFGRCEEGQRTHVLRCFDAPKSLNPPSRAPRESSLFADAIPRSAVVPLRI